MALDPFFQQGMNAWTARNQAQGDRASKLNQLAQAGQMKDLLQRTGHQQKMAEGKQTGQFNLENTFAGHGLAGQKAAEVLGIPMSSATDNVPNALRALRDAGNLQKIGAGAGDLAQQTGQYINNPLGMLQGIRSTFKQGIPGAQLAAAAGNAGKVQDVTNYITLPDGRRVPSPITKVTTSTKVKPTSQTLTAAQQHVQNVMEKLKQQGHTIKTAKSKKLGRVFVATDSGGKRTVYSAEDGRLLGTW